MKKIFFSLLAVAAIASCAKTEEIYTGEQAEIKIKPTAAIATKANVTAAIDGTPKWRVFTKITVPLISPMISYLFSRNSSIRKFRSLRSFIAISLSRISSQTFSLYMIPQKFFLL